MNVRDKSNSCFINKTTVKELNRQVVKPQRAGIILYTNIQNERFFGLGVDTQSKELTDFGGGIKYSKDKDVVKGALREFHEETLGLFKDIKEEQLDDCIVMYNHYMLIIFKYISIDSIDIVQANFLILYQKMVEKHLLKTPEVCEIKWLKQSEFKQAICCRGGMFSRVQNFLQKARNFYWLL